MQLLRLIPVSYDKYNCAYVCNYNIKKLFVFCYPHYSLRLNLNGLQKPQRRLLFLLTHVMIGSGQTVAERIKNQLHAHSYNWAIPCECQPNSQNFKFAPKV